MWKLKSLLQHDPKLWSVHSHVSAVRRESPVLHAYTAFQSHAWCWGVGGCRAVCTDQKDYSQFHLLQLYTVTFDVISKWVCQHIWWPMCVEWLCAVSICCVIITCYTACTMYSLNTPDINECVEESHQCHAHAQCSNTDGSFRCMCKGGWSGDGRNCSGNWHLNDFSLFINSIWASLCRNQLQLGLLEYYCYLLT